MVIWLVACASPPATEEVAAPAPLASVAAWGEVDGVSANLYTLRNRNGLVARVTDFGAILVALEVPDRDGRLADVVLGFDTVDDYATRNDPHLGSTVGRYANRIALGRFSLDGREYELATNNGRHHLHGGVRGFDRVAWRGEALETAAGPAVRLTYRSVDGEEGYPGNLDVTVIYTLTHADELRIEMTATTDAPTLVNLAHHSYWNLAGHDSGDIRDHRLRIAADRYTPTDDEMIPTGELAPVEGTPFDLREPQRLGDRLEELERFRSRDPSGFDENFVLGGSDPAGAGPAELRLAAVLEDPASGRVMEVETNQPGVQLYTGNFLSGLPGKGGAVYDK
ncbi:MAG: aldose epimerase family protein, partial [Thermoanaerobaculia bacterium]|nr:aldose epimerase family protein [Thermoanaerobaculia bacterium]